MPATLPRPSESLVARLDPYRCQILLARISQDLARWVVLSRDTSRVIAHWGTVNHLQTQPGYRNQGMLHLAARSGIGLEHFYFRLGWRETGRWPGKLRLAPGDTRDEILMILTPL